MVEKVEIVHVHFTLEGEGPRFPFVFFLSSMGSLHGFMHGILWIILHGLPKFASSPSTRGMLDANFYRPW